MASIRKEIIVEASAASVWDAVRDVGAVHRRLVPGFVTDTRLEPGVRIVTFASGLVLRELIVDVDDAAMRFVWAAVESAATHHNGAMQVFDEGEGRCRLVWTTDVLPNELAGPIEAIMAQGMGIMQRTLKEQAGASALSRS